MVLSRQTGTDEKLGTPSLRQHAMPSPLHPLLAPLLFSAVFSLFLSNLTVLAPCCPPDFPSPYLSHLIVASRPIPPSRAHPPPLPPVSPYLPASLCFIQTCPAVCCPTLRPEPKQPPPPSPAPSLSYGGRQSPALRLHWGRGVRIQPWGPAAVN